MPANLLADYASEDVIVDYGGVLLTGGASGTFFKGSRRSDSVGLEIGADGSPARFHSADKSGELVLTFLQTSPANDVLSAELATLELTKKGGKPLTVRDLNGRTLLQCDLAWPVKYADVAFSTGLEGREWTLNTGRMLVVVGGNV
jgi:hypothetical protein